VSFPSVHSATIEETPAKLVTAFFGRECLSCKKRTPLNVAVFNDGINWDMTNILMDSPVKEYSYPSVIQRKDGMVHIVYTWRREKVKYIKIDPEILR
jgi:predicted neuraminidase